MERVKRDWCLEAIAFLRAGLDLGPNHDMRTERVYAALDYLETRLRSTWPVIAFRQALEVSDPDARWRYATSSLADISAAVTAGRKIGHREPA